MTSLAHFIYVAEGFMEDCDMLIHSLTEKYDKVDWQKFCKHWKELQFDIVFYGRLSGAELVELTEECLQCARLYMVTETDNYESQVIGIFIAYAIAIVQPYSNLCALRLTPEDVVPLKRVEDIARRDNRTDVLMILGRLYIYSAHYHVFARERAMDYGIRKYYDDSIRVPKTIHKRWLGELNRNSIGNWEKISELEKRYMESKSRFTRIAYETYPGSTQVFINSASPIADGIMDSLSKLILPKKEKEEERSIEDLKTKAMKGLVNPVRHFVGVDQRKGAAISPHPLSDPSAEIPPKKKSKSVRLKIKENSQNVIGGNAIKQYTKPVSKAEPTIDAPTMNSPPSFHCDLIKERSMKSPSSFHADVIKGPSMKSPPSYQADIIKGPAINALPSLDDDFIQNLESVTRVDTPEQQFIGFTTEEIELTNLSLSNSDIDLSPIKKTKKRGENGKQIKSAEKTHAGLDLPDLENTNNIQKIKTKGKKLPQTTFKITKSVKNEAKKRKKSSPKKTVKNKKPSRSKLSNESDSNTDDSNFEFSTIDDIHANDDCIPKTEENIDLFTTSKTQEEILKEESKDVDKHLIQYKENGLVAETNAVPKDFVQYKVNDIVIHAEQGLPDLEIELIDEYNGPINNDVKEQIPETTVDRDARELDIPENIKGELEPMDTEDGSEETVEVVRILTDSEAAVIDTRESLVLPRRKLKRPSLQSKLRKMGILPVANFYNDEDNDS